MSVAETFQYMTQLLLQLSYDDILIFEWSCSRTCKLSCQAVSPMAWE